MKFAPNIIFIFLVVLFVLGSCGQEKKATSKPQKEEKIVGPEIKSTDSSQTAKPSHPPIPDTDSPGRAKKNSKSDLDTLRPIKA